jgi:hypothetical protein
MRVMPAASSISRMNKSCKPVQTSAADLKFAPSTLLEFIVVRLAGREARRPAHCSRRSNALRGRTIIEGLA